MKLQKIFICIALYSTLIIILAASFILTAQGIICDYGCNIGFIAIQLVICITGFVAVTSLVKYYKYDENPETSNDIGILPSEEE